MTPDLLKEYLEVFKFDPKRPRRMSRTFRPFCLVLESGTEIVVASLGHIRIADGFVTVMQGITWSSFEIEKITEIRMKDWGG